jgi:hypothetical protein
VINTAIAANNQNPGSNPSHMSFSLKWSPRGKACGRTTNKQYHAQQLIESLYTTLNCQRNSQT